MTPATIIAESRRLLNDAVVSYRYSDTMLLGYVNQVLKRMVVLRPDLFGEIGEITTTANTTIQSLPTNAQRLIDIFQVKDGDAVVEVDRETLSRSYPGWMTEAAGTPVNYMRHVKNATRFFLYPRPVADTVLIAEYAKVPTDYTIDQSIAAPPESFFPVIVDGVVFLASSVDDEHVESGRAKMFLDSFTQHLSVSLESRGLTDSKAAGLRPGDALAPLGEVT